MALQSRRQAERIVKKRQERLANRGVSVLELTDASISINFGATGNYEGMYESENDWLFGIPGITTFRHAPIDVHEIGRVRDATKILVEKVLDARTSGGLEYLFKTYKA